MLRTWAVPVLPAMRMSGKGRRLRTAVPAPLTTSSMPERTASKWAAAKGKGAASGRGRLISCGTTSRPEAMRAAITASWVGLRIT